MREQPASQPTAAGRPPTVWVIDGDHWERACLGAELLERGYDPVGFRSVLDALETLLRRAAHRPAVALVDLSGQTTTLAEAALLARQGIPIVALGHAQGISDATGSGFWSAFVRRPVTLGKVVDAVTRTA